MFSMVYSEGFVVNSWLCWSCLQIIKSKGARGVLTEVLAASPQLSAPAAHKFGSACMGCERHYGMIVRRERVIFCKSGADFAAESLLRTRPGPEGHVDTMRSVSGASTHVVGTPLLLPP